MFRHPATDTLARVLAAWIVYVLPSPLMAAEPVCGGRCWGDAPKPQAVLMRRPHNRLERIWPFGRKHDWRLC